MLAFGAGIVAVVIFSALFFTGKGFGGHYGLAQRIALVSVIVWIGALALALFDLYGQPSQSAKRVRPQFARRPAGLSLSSA